MVWDGGDLVGCDGIVGQVMRRGSSGVEWMVDEWLGMLLAEFSTSRRLPK